MTPEKAAFNCAQIVINHLEKIINDYMQKNYISLRDWQKYGSYNEYQDNENNGYTGVLKYKENVFHTFRYNSLGIIS